MYKLIAGVDEAGYGPLAGPIVAAAVILDPLNRIYKLRDSKILSEKQREILFARIHQKALAVSVGRVSVAEINQINIYHANMLAMKRAIYGLKIQPERVLIDGRCRPKINLPSETIVDGDVLETVISAASIIAKVTRDREMKALDVTFPQYGFAKHKGYATKEHKRALELYGPSLHHRRGFQEVKKYFSLVLY